MSRMRATSVGGLLLLALAPIQNCQAAVPATLYDPASCTAFDTAPLGYVFCDDGVPAQGGTTPNATGAAAITVPAKYGTAEDGHTGLPAKAADANTVSGADANGDIALDVDVTLPLTPPPAGGYPLLVFMHGCCSGNKKSWEATSFDVGGERWHYSNAWFASRGYAVLTYTARGFRTTQTNATPNRGSTGQSQLDSRRFEMNDFQHLACQMVANANLWTGIKGAGGGSAVAIDPNKVVTTGGSYGGGFAWMALTDPKWTCTDDTGANGVNMSLAAVAPRYGWTDLVYSLVPTGRHFQDPATLPATNGCNSGPRRLDGTPCDATAGDPLTPAGIPKSSIVAGLYASGATGAPGGSDRATFPSFVDEAAACLEGSYPLESNPACANTVANVLPEFLRDRSAYYQNDFFANIANDPSYRVPVFNVATLTDPLFPMHENRRMHNRLRSVAPDYPLQTYFMDNQHFVQNKAKDWGDVCGADRHVCSNDDYALTAGGFDFNAVPKGLRHTGATTRLNGFIDFYTRPSANPAVTQPPFNETVTLQLCDATAAAMGIPATESADTFSAPTFEGLSNAVFELDIAATQTTTSTVTSNTHAADADPIANTASNSSKCVVHPSSQAAGPGVAVFNSDLLTEDVVMIGPSTVTLDFTVMSAETNSVQLNARLYDVFPSGDAVMIDRGPRRLSAGEVAAKQVSFQLHGNAYRFLKDHRIRVEIAQDDNPYLKNSTPPSSTSISRLRLSLPQRVPANSNGTVLVRAVNSVAAAGTADVAAGDFSLYDNGDRGHEISMITIGVNNPDLLTALKLSVEGQEIIINGPAASNEFTLTTPVKVRPGGLLNFSVATDLSIGTTTAAIGILGNPAYAAFQPAGATLGIAGMLGFLLAFALWATRLRKSAAAMVLISLSLLGCSNDDRGCVEPPAPASEVTTLSLTGITGTADDAQTASYPAGPHLLGTVRRGTLVCS